MTSIAHSRRGRCTQDDILEAFATRVKTIQHLNDRNVVVSSDPLPSLMPKGSVCISVSPGDGRFDEKKWNGGGPATLNELGSVIVGCYLVNMRDSPGRSEQAVLSDTSFTAWKRRLLKALCINDPKTGYLIPWEPMKPIKVDGADVLVPLLREPPRPTHCTEVMEVGEHKGWSGFQLSFAVSFDWDLLDA